MTVAITGMNAQPDNPGPGLSVARCLKESPEFTGRIIGLGYDALDAGLYVKQYCDIGYLLPYPSSESFEHINRLQSIHEKEHIDILIPCLDSELLGMIHLIPTLETMGIRTFLPSPEQLMIRNKDRLSELIHNGDLVHPKSVNITNSNFFHDCERQGWTYPFVVKGIFYDAKIVYNTAQGIAAFDYISAEWGLPVIIQKFVLGQEYDVAALGDGRGNVSGMVMMKKLSYSEKGKASAGVSVYDETLHRICQTIMKVLSWKGPIEFEIMRDKQGQYNLIEINPRFPAWVYLTAGVGQNLPIMLLKLIMGISVPELTSTATGVMFIRHAIDSIVLSPSFESVVIDGRTL